MGMFSSKKYITLDIRKHIDSSDKLADNENKEYKPYIPNDKWVKCPECGMTLYKEDLEKGNLICIHCHSHLRMGVNDRVKLIIDEGTFEEFDVEIESGNPLGLLDYDIKRYQNKTGLKSAVLTGKGNINSKTVIIAIMEFAFKGGSMSAAEGEKITRAIEKATAEKLPIIIFTASGGARMEEGIFSLMQMAKTSAALAKHSEAGLLYITVLTDPTTGGITASFAMLGDIILAEPGTLIGFAGKRVIEQTIKQQLPDEFQTSEFLLEHGFIDKIVVRGELKTTIGKILEMHE
ncbi:MAG TPA: acetyl-CoA carboxylase carboxyl transferase subunit beta [Clostridiales bacterium]|nr:MAG: acetyl-CoA carboxylase subunit beta [Clostridiales bacterium GWD2_32_59]HAN09185.1 acetyl-CoA carboxylase carboxyl transferase subunit beta [Clostridiales bacterium]